MNKPYEIMLLLRNESELQQKALENIRLKIQEAGGTLNKEVPLGTQTLAYPIAKQKKGHYHLLDTTLDTQKVGSLNSEFKLIDGLLRFLVVSK